MVVVEDVAPLALYSAQKEMIFPTWLDVARRGPRLHICFFFRHRDALALRRVASHHVRSVSLAQRAKYHPAIDAITGLQGGVDPLLAA